MYYVYVLESLKDKSWYIGYTSNLSERINQHNNGESKYTSKHTPYKCILYIAFIKKSDAKRYEKYLKSGYGRRTLMKMMKDYLKDHKIFQIEIE